jgi:hypothetical protein
MGILRSEGTPDYEDNIGKTNYESESVTAGFRVAF